MGSSQSHDLSHKSEKLAQVNFGLFLKHFFQIFFAGIFSSILLMGSSQFNVLDHVFDLLT
jgi:hypothetical protein